MVDGSALNGARRPVEIGRTLQRQEFLAEGQVAEPTSLAGGRDQADNMRIRGN